MNVISCSIKTLKGSYDISGVEVGQHLYWEIGGLQIHAQVLITSWVVIAILLGLVIIAVMNPQTIPTNGQNFFEYILEFIRDFVGFYRAAKPLLRAETSKPMTRRIRAKQNCLYML